MKIGVLGVGHLGKIHLKLLKQIEGVELVGFYDINPITTQLVSQEFSVIPFESMNALIAKVDAIDIVTPTPSHFECAQAAIKAGKHVFVEKPLTFTPEESATLLKLAKESQVFVQVGHVERFNPAFLAMKSEIARPLYIDTQRFAIFNTRGIDVPVVLDLMIHDIDIVLSTVRSPIRRISASGMKIITDTIDMANARIEFINGSVANLNVSRIATENVRTSRFFMRDAMVSVDFLNKSAEKVSLVSKENDLDLNRNVRIPIEWLDKKPELDLAIFKPEINQNNAILDELTAFYLTVDKKAQAMVPIEDGHEAVVVAHMIMDKILQKN